MCRRIARDGGEASTHGPSRQSRLEAGARVFDASQVADANLEGKFVAIVPGFEDDAEKDLRLKRLLQRADPGDEGRFHRSISHLY